MVVVRGKVLAIRRRGRGKAKFVLSTLTSMLRRGMRSKLESLRQVSGAIQEVVQELWPSVEHVEAEPSEIYSRWLTNFWQSTRAVCRRAAQRFRRERRREQAVAGEDMEMDSDPDPSRDALQPGDAMAGGNFDEGQVVAAPVGGEIVDEGAGPERGEPTGALQAGVDMEAASGMDSRCVDRASGTEPEQDKDVVSLMALDTPPWKRPRSNRDKWLKRDEDSHRRRERDRRPRRSRTPETRREKGKEVSASPRHGPAGRWEKGGPRRAETAAGSSEVVTVDPEALSHDGALSLWMQILELRHMGPEPNNYGLPQYQVDNLVATMEDLDATDVATLLSAYGHVQGLCQAQVATAANARLRRIREQQAAPEPGAEEVPEFQEEDEEENEWSSMMQAAPALHTVQGGLSTFAIHLQSMTDQFSEMTRPRQIVRSNLLRGRLASRYGTGAGRKSMGGRAENVEALMGAFAETQDDTVFFQETAADVQWINSWWPIMEAAMREEESLANRACSVACNLFPRIINDVPPPSPPLIINIPGGQKIIYY